MVNCGSQFFRELRTGVAARSLMAAVWSLLEALAGGEAIVSKTKLCTLHNPSMQWLSSDAVKTNTLGALPRNIAKNFMATFYPIR